MVLAELRAAVQDEFPVEFEKALIKDDVDRLIDRAFKYVRAKCEKIKSTTVTGSQTISDALVITKCVPVGRSSAEISVFDMMHLPDRGNNVEHYFTPERQLILNFSGDVYIEYVVDPEELEVSDLNAEYIELLIKYAVALLKESEGYAGTTATLTDLPFEFNYADMRADGQEQKTLIREQLEEKYFGAFASRS